MLADKLLKKCLVELEAVNRASGWATEKYRRDLVNEVRDYIREYVDVDEPAVPTKPVDPELQAARFTQREVFVLNQFHRIRIRQAGSLQQNLWEGVIRAFVNSPAIRQDATALLCYEKAGDMENILQESPIWIRILAWNRMRL